MRHIISFRMRYKRALCIYNPAAGRGARQSALEAVRQGLSAHAGNVRLAPTSRPGHATDLASQAAAEGCDLVAVHSGDGTINEVVQGLAGKNSPALLALPGGTANVLVSELGIPADPAKAARMLPQLVTKPVRLGRVIFDRDGTSRYFLLMCGAGLDAAIAGRVSKPLKRRFGQAAYWAAAARFSLQRLPRVRVSASGDGAAGPWCGLVLASKSRLYGGGLVLTPRAHLLSSHFVTAQYAGTGRLAYSGYLAGAMCRLLSRCPGVRLDASDDLALEPGAGETAQVQVDGEVVGELPARVTLSDATCRILMPKHYTAGGDIRSNGRSVLQ